MPKIYPRLEAFEYEEKIQFVENIINTTNSYNYSANDSDLHWLPMGNRAELMEIEILRAEIIAFMKSENLRPACSAQERTAFDRKLGIKLLEWLDITPSIAADNGMWAYMNIVLVPELIQMRWGYTEKGEARKINHERYYDTNRSYLKKLWITASFIKDKNLFTKLKQDEIDVWYDKAFNRGLDNYIQQIYFSFYKNVNAYKIKSDLGDLYRQFLTFLNRKFAYINYYALDSENIKQVFDEAFNEAYNPKTENAQFEKNNANSENEIKEFLRKKIIEKRNSENENALARLRNFEQHFLDEDFLSTKPVGFILQGVPFEGISNWKNLYTTFISFCVKKDSEKMRNLLDNPRFMSKIGLKYFSSKDSDLRRAEKITEGFYIEVNLSSKDINRMIKFILKYLQIHTDEFEIYLRKQ